MSRCVATLTHPAPGGAGSPLSRNAGERAERSEAGEGVAPRAGRLAGRIALITGASRGIGAAVALRFAVEGAHVVLAARTVGGLEELDDVIRGAGGTTTLVPLDLCDFIKIDELAAKLFDRYGRLDILVGNAAEFGVFSPLGHIDPATWAEVIDLNLTANWRLIRAMDPLLREAPAGRAVFVTSGVARGVFPYWGPYAVSKAGLEMLVKIYAGEISKTRVRVNLIDPGIVRTRLRARAFPGEDPSRLPPPESVADAFLALALPECTRNGEVVMASAVSLRPNE
jgi:NAD(P)-dependent dehydrogenase (short-subunit alcohol dehydrogenase family)